MKTLWPIPILIAFFVLVTLSQTKDPAPTPTRLPDTEVVSPTPPVDNDVVKISTALIQVDVSVTDSKGKAVSDLKPEEIEISENGKKQKITHFKFVSVSRTVVDKAAAKEDIAMPGRPVPLQREQVHRTIALVVDDYGLSFESIYFTKRTLRKFVAEQMQEGDLVAIMLTGQSIGTLANFTTDKRVLNAAIDRVRYNLMGTGGSTAQDPIDPTMTEMLKGLGDPFITDADVENDRKFQDAFKDFRAGTIAEPFATMSYAVSKLKEMPGRKSVILFSDGFSLSPPRGGPGIIETINPIIEQATRASVVFYAVDPRGLQTTGYTAADKIVNPTAQAYSSRLSAQFRYLFDTQGGLVYLTEKTGGFTIKNQNDLSDGVRRVMDDQSYYLVGYEPDADTFDSKTRKFNKLEVKVSRKGVNTRYRSGFFNFATESASVEQLKLAPQQQLEAALVSPFAESGVGLRLTTLFGNDRASGSYVTSLLHIDGNGMKFTDQPDGTKKVEFEILAVSYGRDGKLVDKLAKGYTLHFAHADADRFISGGFVYRFTFPITKPGAYQYRVALRDTQGGKIGTASQFLAVPDLEKKQLTLSGILLENMTVEEYQRLMDPKGGTVTTDPAGDTAIGKFRAGTVLRYGLDIYNAPGSIGNRPVLRAKVRLFCDGKLILSGDDFPVDLTGQPNMSRIQLSRAMVLGTEMPRGEYVLQIFVRDDSDSSKKKIANQFVQFEVVD